MNIFEAFIKKYSQMIILVLGMPCTNKSDIAKELGLDLSIQIVNINDYLIKDKFVEKEVDNVVFKLYEDPECYDWEKLNNKINEIKSEGVVVYGNYIDKEKINWDIDYVFFFSMGIGLCKKLLIEKKMLQYEDSEPKLKVYFENIFTPMYEKLKTDIKVNKFFNIKDNTTFDETYDEVFEILMGLINKKLKF